MNMKKAKIESAIELVGPRAAAEMLKGNMSNRNLRRKVVEKYARAMSQGDWVLNGQAIVMSSEGGLLDGQHRLSAVVQSGCSVEMMVVRNVEDRAQRTMDSGTARRPADHLKMYLGMTNTTKVVSMLRVLNGLKNGSFDVMTTPEVERAVDEFSDELRITDELYKNQDTRQSAYLAALGWAGAISPKLEAAAVAFSEGVRDMVGLSKGSPALALRRFLMTKNKGGSGRAILIANATLRAFSAYVAGQELFIVRSGSSGYEHFAGLRLLPRSPSQSSGRCAKCGTSASSKSGLCWVHSAT
jgi:hypothetical protein